MACVQEKILKRKISKAQKRKIENALNITHTEKCKQLKEDEYELPTQLTDENNAQQIDNNVNRLSDDSVFDYNVATSQKFESLCSSISKATMDTIEKMGFKEMTEIQARCIPPLLHGKDLRGTAKTGSGKTLAFLIPVVELLSTLKFKPRNGTGAIIISPTRELSLQTYGVLRDLMENHSQTYGIIMGGANRKSEAEKLSKGVSILVATPGRLLDHLEHTPNFMYKNLCALVLDEADRILDVGFEEELKRIIKLLPERRQTMLFSATKDNKINEIAKLALGLRTLEVDVDSDKIEATVEGLEQAYLVCPTDKRFLVLYTFIRKNLKKKVMIFFNSCLAVKFYTELLNYIDVKVMGIHGKQKQMKRTSTFYSFNNSDQGVLLCTDVAARGWDIPAVDWIVQYDPPDNPKEYIHRVGRTARAGRKGRALLFLQDNELGFIRYLKSHKVSLEPMDITWSKVANIQLQLEKLMMQNYFLNSSARSAFKGYVRAYQSYELKEVFDANQLDLKKVAKCFGFTVPPFVDLKTFPGHKERRRSYRNDKRVKKIKTYKHIK